MGAARDPQARIGRAHTTTAAAVERAGLELFINRGFEHVTVDDIAAAARIGRRTFFRYFPSKNDLPWGDFDGLLRRMREHLDTVPPHLPLYDALRAAVIEFNSFSPEELPLHRRRMEILLRTPVLVAHSALRYQSWRQIIADFVAAGSGVRPDALRAQAAGWACLGISLAAYEKWLADEEAVLTELIDQGFCEMREVFSARTVTDGV